MEESVQLRAMEAADADAVAALIRQAFAAQPIRVDPLPSALRVSAHAIAAHLRRDAGAVAVAAGHIIGALLWSERHGALYVARLSVDPDWRRRGIAAALLARVEAAARHTATPRLFLETRLALEDNRRLFAAHGYHEVSRSAHAGYTEPTSVLMEKWLDPD